MTLDVGVAEDQGGLLACDGEADRTAAGFDAGEGIDAEGEAGHDFGQATVPAEVVSNVAVSHLLVAGDGTFEEFDGGVVDEADFETLQSFELTAFAGKFVRELTESPASRSWGDCEKIKAECHF